MSSGSACLARRRVDLPVPENGRGRPVIVPGSAGAQRPGGALVLEAHARPYTLDQPDGTQATAARR